MDGGGLDRVHGKKREKVPMPRPSEKIAASGQEVEKDESGTLLGVAIEAATDFLKAMPGSEGALATYKRGRRAFDALKALVERSNAEVFSRLDHWHASLNDRLKNPQLRYNDLKHDIGIFETKSPEYTDAGEVTMVFLPGDTSLEEAKSYGFIPKWGKTIVFTTPSGFVNCDPAKTKQIFLNVIQDAQREINKVLQDSLSQKINVISYSAANGAGYYTANNLLPKDNQGRFTSVATGSGLGKEIFNSPILKEIRKDAIGEGVIDGNDFNKVFYDKEFGFLLPESNCSHLPESTTIILGKNDMYIPLEFGEEMASKAKTINSKVELQIQPWGHIGTCLYTAHMQNLKHMKSVQIMQQDLTEETFDKYEQIFSSRGLILPQDEVKIWASVFTILCRSRESLNDSKLILEDDAKRNIETIARDFLTAILPETNKKIAIFLSLLNERVIGRRLQTFQ